MKTYLLLGTFVCVLCRAPADVPSPAATTRTPDVPKESAIVLNNQTFLLAGKEEGRAVSTYRYIPVGATALDWTEMVTHQLLKLSARSGADEVLAFLKEKSGNGIRLDGILETRKAAVFASLAPKNENTESQLGVGMVFIDLVDPLEVHVISFTLKPNRLNTTEVEAKLRSWRDLFRARATALASS